MTNKTQALGRRLIGALRNENAIVVSQPHGDAVTLVNAKTGKTVAFIKLTDSGYFLLSDVNSVNFSSFSRMVTELTNLPAYPAAKDRQPRMQVKTHGAPKYVGISMGSFKPGNLSLDF